MLAIENGATEMTQEKNEAWLLEVFTQVRNLSLEAGNIIRRQWPRTSHVTHKARIDLVTETDVAVEKFLSEHLPALVPESSLMAEESYSGEALGEWTWVVDPVDGTTNFVHRHPFVAVSIALCHKGQVVMGIVNAPMLNECYWAVRGHGAFVNETRLHVSQTQSLDQSMIAFGMPYTIDKDLDEWIALFRPVLPRAQAMRRCGSAAIDLSYVAAGIYDGFYEAGLRPWDAAAGWLLVEEAGGRVSRYNGEPYFLGSYDIAATNANIHTELTRLLMI